MQFDDLKSKPLLERFLITINQLNDKTINSWKLTELLSNFGSNYYKIDLIHSLSSALNQGINPEDILIFEKPINYNYNNYNFKELELNKHVFEIYRLGLPTPIFPNIKALELKLFFNLYKEVNKKLIEFDKIQLIQSSKSYGLYKLSEFYEMFTDIGFEKAVNNVVSSALNQIPKDAFIFREAIRKLENSAIYEFRIFYENRKKIKNISKEIKTQKNINFNEHKSLFFDFFDIFKNIDKPLIAIYDHEFNKLNFLCSYHFNPTENDALLMTIDKVSHNSPYQLIFQAAGWIVSPFMSKLITEKKAKKELEEHYLKLKISQEEEKQLDKLYYQMDYLYDEIIKNEIKKMKSNFLRDNLEQLINEATDSFQRILKKYEFDLAYIKIKKT